MTPLKYNILLVSMLIIYLTSVGCFNVMISDFLNLWKHAKRKIAAIKVKNNETTIDFLKSNGYPVESHVVRTKDDYLLTLHHIPYGKKEDPVYSAQHTKKPIVLLQHGFLWSSMAWVVMGPERSLSYLLADNGYDVWVGNSRGNIYSRKHIKYTPDKDKETFWNFSWHEMGYYDLPATIDYILNVTRQTQLYFVGYSMGATAYYVLTSLKPEYNAKIKAMFCLAPIVYPNHMRSPFAKVLHFIRFKLEWFLQTFNLYEVFPSGWFLDRMNDLLCSETSRLQKLCKYVLFLMIGYDYAQLNDTALPIIFLHLPAGTSLKSMVHYLQLMDAEHLEEDTFKPNEEDTAIDFLDLIPREDSIIPSVIPNETKMTIRQQINPKKAPGYDLITGTKFRQYDYGEEGNIINYNSKNPPAYPLHRVTTPVYMYYAQNDWLSPPKDVERLLRVLPNVVSVYKVPYENFNHLDFVWAVDVKHLLYDNIIRTLNTMSGRTK